MSWLAALHARLCAGELKGAERLLLSVLAPLGWLYGLIAWLRVMLYRRGVFSSYRAAVPVISVGNIAVGGTGKTPTVDALLKHLLGSGCKVAVVSRGYGGSGGQTAQVVCEGAGPMLEPRVCGDEPFLLARRNPGAIVVIARRRADGVRLAVERCGAEMIILDDGFQHLAVQRDLDIVLLDCRRPFGNGHVLPAGPLREFPGAAQRADVFLLTRCPGEGYVPRALPAPTFRSRHCLSGLAQSLLGEDESLASLQGLKGLAFAGIADPPGFFRQLEDRGLLIVQALGFSDHAAYDEADLARLLQAARDADYLITTEKDGVKLAGKDLPLPCYQVPMQLEIDNRDDLMQRLTALLPEEKTMAVPPELLEILACPQCKGQIRYEAEKDEIVCESCRLIYPVRDDIPVMLLDEAKTY